MTTTQNPEHVVTSCPDHGVKVTADFASFQTYVNIARADDFGWTWHDDQTVTRDPAIAAFDAERGVDPWRCCWHMVIDPYGVLDF